MGFICSSSDNSDFSSCPTFASNSGVCCFICNISGVCVMLPRDTSPFFLLLVFLVSLSRHDACPLQIHVKEDLLSLSQQHDARQILAEMNAFGLFTRSSLFPTAISSGVLPCSS